MDFSEYLDQILIEIKEKMWFSFLEAQVTRRMAKAYERYEEGLKRLNGNRSC